MKTKAISLDLLPKDQEHIERIKKMLEKEGAVIGKVTTTLVIRYALMIAATPVKATKK